MCYYWTKTLNKHGGVDGCLLIEPPVLILVLINQARLNAIYTANLLLGTKWMRRSKSLSLSVLGATSMHLRCEYSYIFLNTHYKNQFFNILFTFKHNSWLSSASLQNNRSVSFRFILNSPKPGPKSQVLDRLRACDVVGWKSLFPYALSLQRAGACMRGFG